MTDTNEPTARDAVMGDNSETMDIKAMLREEPKAIYHDGKMLPKLLAQLDAEIASAPKDVTDKKDRESVRSAAFDIAKLKTKLDGAGKDLTEDFRKKTKEVNDVRNEITAALEKRQTAMREPLTAWEEAEKVRDEKVRDTRRYLEESRNVPANAPVEKVKARREKVAAMVIDAAVYQELAEKVEAERTEALQALDAAIAASEQAERDRAELDRLRAAEAERQREAEAERKRQAAAEEARIQREADEREKAEAIAAAAREAEERTRREAEEAAAAVERQRQADEAEVRRKAQEAVDAANARAAEAERAAAAAAEAERQRIAAAERADEEAEERRRDQEHRATVIANIEADLQANGASAPVSKRLAQALVAGSVRNVKVEF